MEKQITISAIGPIGDTLVLPLKEGGGITWVLGRNGLGKTHALDAVRALTGAGNALQHTDGLDKGTVEGLGVKITAAKSTRRTGELEVQSLEGTDPMKLVDPGIKDPSAADDERIRVLCSLAKVVLTHEQFAALIGGADAMREIVNRRTLDETGAPEMAAAFKRDFEAQARKLEGEAKVQEGRAEGLRQSLEEIDLAVESDAGMLGKATEQAVRALATAEGEAKSARDRRAKTAAARARLEQAAAERSGLTSRESREKLVVAQQKRSLANDAVSASVAQVEEASRELDRRRANLEWARREAAQAEKDVETGEAFLKAALDGEKAMDDARVLAESDPGAAGPSDEQLADLSRSVQAAKKRQENGAVIRAAQGREADAKFAADKAADLRRESERFREAALGCEELLTHAIQSVAPRGLRVRNGRLVVPTSRGETIFAELSKGERTRIAVDIAIDSVGEGGLLVLSQEAAEGLDPLNVEALDKHLRERNTHMLGARNDAGPLRAETFTPKRNGAA